MYPTKSVHRPWKSGLALGSRLGLFSYFLPLYLLGLKGCPLFLLTGIFDSFPPGGQDGFDLTISPPFLDLYCFYVEFAFFVCRNLYGVIKAEICINCLLCSLLDR